VFIKYDIGLGKTTICWALSTLYALKDNIVLMLNKSKDLLCRDFKKADDLLAEKVDHYLEPTPEIACALDKGCVIYISLDKLLKLMDDAQGP
jgi:hypothetical protein